MSLLHGNIVGQVAVERSDDDFGWVAGFRIEGDYLSGGVDSRIGASRGLDSDGLAGEAMYSCFDFLLYRFCVFLIFGIRLYRVPSYSTMSAYLNILPTYHASRTRHYSTSSKRAMGMRRPCGGPS